VTVYNRTGTKVSAVWVIPPTAFPQPTGTGAGGRAGGSGAPAPIVDDGVGGGAGGGGGSGVTNTIGSFPGFVSSIVRDWAVVPEVADIEPGGSAEFKVAFRPSGESLYYCQDLEVHVAPKVNRSFRLVDEESFTPPIVCAVRAMGHTFRDIATFLPKLSTSFGGTAPEQTLVLPPCSLGDEVYYTVRVNNDSDVPAAFELPLDPSGALQWMPRKGVIPLRSGAMITARFRPLHARAYALPVDMRVNGSLTGGFRLHVVASGGLPRLALPDGLQLFLRPTGVGTSTSRTAVLRNASRLPLTYRWRGASSPDAPIDITPAEGDLEGNDSVEVTVTCSPQAPAHVEVELPCAAHFLRGSETAAAELVTRLAATSAGAGGGGTVVAVDPALLAGPGGWSGGSSASPPVVAGLDEEGGGLVLHAAHEAVQTVRVQAVTEGLTGAVHFAYPAVDLGAVLVSSSHNVPIMLSNTTDGSLPFAIDAVVQVQLSHVDADAHVLRRMLQDHGAFDPAALLEDPDYAAATGGRLPPPAATQHVHTVALSCTAPSALVTTHAHGVATRVPIVTFEPATGVLPPRSRQQVTMKLSPAWAATHRLRLYINLLNADGSTNALATAHSRASAISAAVAAERDPREPSFIDWGVEPRNADDMWCDVTVQAAFPSAHVEDARQLHSREALLCLFPSHMAGLHNRFRPAGVVDRGGVPALAARPIVAEVEASTFAAAATASASTGRAPSSRAGASLSATAAALSSTTAASPPLPPPAGDVGGLPPAPRDLWVRGDLFTADLARVRGGVAAVKPVDPGWGGWGFMLPPAPEDGSPAPPALAVSSPWTLWQQFSLAQLNSAWSTRLNAAEEAFLTAAPARRDPRSLSHVVWEFTPAVLDTPPMAVMLQLRNTSPVPAVLDFLLDHELDVEEVEPWVDMPEPDAHAANLVEMTSRRIMDVQPRSLRLQPGEAGVIRCHYSYASLSTTGVHELPMVAQFRGGKAVRVTMRGITLPHASPFLWNPNPAHRVCLASVAIGAREPPTQTVALMNPTDHPIAWNLDADSLQALGTLQYGFRVFHVESSGGVVPPRSSGALRVTFIPIEPKEYELRVRVVYSVATDEVTAAIAAAESGGAAPILEEGGLDLCLTGWGYAPRLHAVAEAGSAPLTLLPQSLRGAVGLLPADVPASFGAAAAVEAVADAQYKLAGLDAVSAAVSTFFNPLDVLTVLQPPGAGGRSATAAAAAASGGHLDQVWKHLVVEQDASPSVKAILFSGKDAGASARALGQYLHAVDLCDELSGEDAVAEGKSGAERGQVLSGSSRRARKARPSTVQPASTSPAGPAAYSVFHSLAARLLAGKLWPRITRPDAQPPLFHGAAPPISRHLPALHHDLPEGIAVLSSEMVDFGDVPSQCVAHHVVILRNCRRDEVPPGAGPHGRAQAVAFSWDATHPLLASGVVRIHPMAGEIPAGEGALVRFSVTAPATAAVIADDIACTVSVPAAEHRERCEATVTALVRQRDALRRSRHHLKPGTDKAHVSVAEKTTASRALALQEVAQSSLAKVARSGAYLHSTKRVDGHAEPAIPAATVQRLHAATRPGVLSAAGQAITSMAKAPSTTSRALVSTLVTAPPTSPKQATALNASVTLVPPAAAAAGLPAGAADSPFAASVDEATAMLAAILVGDLSLDESAILVEDGGEGEGTATSRGGSVRASMDFLPLPPPASAQLHVRVALRCMLHAEFAAEYSPAHLAAFHRTHGSGSGDGDGTASVPPAYRDGSGVAATALSTLPPPVQTSAHDIICGMLADILQEADMAGAVESVASARATITAPAAATATAAPDKVTFTDIAARPTTSHAALLDLALAAGSASGVAPSQASVTPLEHSVERMGNPVYNAHLPAPRLGDAEWSHNVPAAVALHGEAECRDFVERMLESTLLLVMREALTADVTAEALAAAPGATAATTPGGARSRAPRLSFVDELPVDLLEGGGVNGEGGDDWSGVAGATADSVLAHMTSEELQERLGRAAPVYHAADGDEEE